MWDGPIAEDLARLWWALLGLGAAVYVLVLVLLAVPALRRRPGTGAAAAATAARPDVPARVANRWIVAGGVVLPGVLLPVVLGVSVAAMRDIPRSVPPGGLVIEVVGHQWWWEARYPDHDVTVANEIHIPVGEPVELRLTSADVIHSFWVPELAGKLDALPDGVNTLVIEADEPGEYLASCAEFCGLQHAKMLALVVAEPPDVFADWLAGQRRPAAEPRTEETARGREVFLRAGCASCHTVRGVTTAEQPGPDLTHFADRRRLTAALLDGDTASLGRWIRDPDKVKEGTAMPESELTAAELDRLLAYLESLE